MLFLCVQSALDSDRAGSVRRGCYITVKFPRESAFIIEAHNMCVHTDDWLGQAVKRGCHLYCAYMYLQ